MNDVTQILEAIHRGETQATDQLLPLVYARVWLRRAIRAAWHLLRRRLAFLP